MVPQDLLDQINASLAQLSTLIAQLTVTEEPAGGAVYTQEQMDAAVLAGKQALKEKYQVRLSQIDVSEDQAVAALLEEDLVNL